jgi:hypothetical protein
MGIWDRFEGLILQYMESRTADLLDQCGGASSPWVVRETRDAAAFAAEQAIAKFRAKKPKPRDSGDAREGRHQDV